VDVAAEVGQEEVDRTVHGQMSGEIVSSGSGGSRV
jgi:hypothetical protein